MKFSSYIALLVILLSSHFSYAQNFEGRTRVKSTRNAVDFSKDDKKDIWYVLSKDEYRKREEHLFDTTNMAFYQDTITEVMGEDDEALLKKTGVDYGFFHGVYYVVRKERTKEYHDDKDYYIAFLGLDLNHFNVRVSYRGFNNQYVLDYNIKRQKNKQVYFRLITESWFDINAIKMRAEMQRNTLVLTNFYNKQSLTLYITPFENKFNQLLRNWGINKKPLSVFLVPPAPKKKQYHYFLSFEIKFVKSKKDSTLNCSCLFWRISKLIKVSGNKDLSEFLSVFLR